MTAAEQARAFAAMAACGAAVGAAHDLLRPILRGGMAHILDLALGVLAAAGMISTALFLQTDAFRLYAFAGVLAGIALYMLTIGTIVRRLAACVRTFVKKSKMTNKKAPDVAGK